MRARQGMALAAGMLLLLSGCDWTQLGANAAHTHVSDHPRLYASNAPSAIREWSAGIAAGGFASPTVAQAVVYIGSPDELVRAFDANGKKECVPGPPADCSELRSYQLEAATNSAAAVVGGFVYVTDVSGTLSVFDAAGQTNCTGTVPMCQPLWTASTGDVIRSSPTVADGRVFVTSHDQHIYAFDAAGQTNCSGTPTVCQPLWTAATEGPIDSTPAVDKGTLYVGSDDSKLYAFDASGVTNCMGSPVVCQPLWTSIDFGNHAIPSSPAVANGKVYIGVAGGVGAVYAFDAAGVTNCTTMTTTTCQPLWQSSTLAAVGSSDPAVTRTNVFVGGFDGLYAFDANGVVNCTPGTTATCQPRWVATAPGDIMATSAAVVNDVVYVASPDNNVYGFDIESCDSDTGCEPIWTGPAHLNTSAPVVAAGRVFAVSHGTGSLFAWQPQTAP